jgi:hypothetical protein
MTSIHSDFSAIILAAALLAACASTNAAQALSDRLANVSPSQRLVLLRGKCAKAGARDKYGPRALTADGIFVPDNSRS